MNKKIFPVLFLSCFLIQTTAAQSSSESSEGGRFSKRIEYNFLIQGLHNLKSKTDVDKLFFGDFNAELEFLVEPSFEGAYGFRIVKDPLDASCRLELKHIGNFKEVNSQISKKYPSIGFSLKEIDTVSEEKKEQARQHNNVMYEKRREERLKSYRVNTQYFPIKNDFAEKLYVTVVAAIDNFKGKGIPPIIMDGFSVTFRCVVGDEVWTFTIHQPQGKLLKLTNLCEQIMEDIETNNLNESKYIALFESVSNNGI
jgi:hypothetical protein